MYAIVQHGGHQYRVEPGDRLLVDQLQAEVGSVVALEPVIFLQGSKDAKGSRVAASVIAHHRGQKLRVFKYKPKKRYRRTMGHRSHLTELLVESLLKAGDPLPKATVIAPPKPAAPHKAAPHKAAPHKAAPAKPAAKTEVPAPAKAEVTAPKAAVATPAKAAPAKAAPKKATTAKPKAEAPAKAAPKKAAPKKAAPKKAKD
jgi:large subunit ribosomal protein L21